MKLNKSYQFNNVWLGEEYGSTIGMGQQYRYHLFLSLNIYKLWQVSVYMLYDIVKDVDNQNRDMGFLGTKLWF